MDISKIISYLVIKEEIPTHILLSFKNEINTILQECDNEARHFKKVNLLPKDRTNLYLSNIVLQIKYLHLHGFLQTKNIEAKKTIENFLSQQEINFNINNKQILLDKENKEKLINFFTKYQNNI